ncbi:CBF-domain-containing protein [Basidiobolus meristosporus CBS 931.73]|uniref:CBF-domain-containing protein n=1 Tax=Basidiobolus meristosporus CBS 931.73 TaxID=1314790 RepID=A0A1Y1YJQ7_9FUNG|nr:CBF-domain-containing protein [Basidiobolus meristosporus CBS 931.73]|eukprot:ORX98239.1 CBF-domain-containing protein [Basidiobolus meristosporus CBS 931.73]
MAPVRKKKRTDSKPKAAKKEIEEATAQIRSLEKEVQESKKNLNDIVKIVAFCENEHPEVIYAAINSLQRIFVDFLKKGQLQKVKENPNADGAEKAKFVVSTWLRDHYIQYYNHLLKLLSHKEPTLQVTALNLLLDFTAKETTVTGVFPNFLYYKIVETLANNENFNGGLQSSLMEKYLNYYDDLRYYFLKDLAKVFSTELTRSTDKSKLVANGFAILEQLRTMPTDESEIDEFWTDEPKVDESDAEKKPLLLQLQAHRKVFSDCWIAFLRLPLTTDIYKKVLVMMHKKIIVHLPQPTLLMDFLTDSYNAGGAISLLALNGLFTLIHEHNLDYPDFYKKLYALLDRNVLHVKYRSRFFRLLDLFLSSTHLSSSLVAAFVKRLARLSLSAPPAGIIIIIPIIYNLLKRHPSTMVLIHRGPDDQVETAEADPYCFSEADPLESNAMQSSLWEIETLKDHYFPNVSSLAKIFSEKFNKPSYNLEDFLDHTYTTLISAELGRKVKKTPALAIEGSQQLFNEDDVYSSLWTLA